MNNKDIATVFLEIADMLELKNDNVFKVRAYRTAANNILGLGRQLSDISKEDPGLISDIPGIGKDLKEKITEMVDTGALKFYRELQREFPGGFLDMLGLSGMGPKKLAKLRDELGVKNVNDLEKACKEGKVAALDGMGDKTQAKFLEAVEYYKKQAGRMLLQEASEYAAGVMSYLEKSGLFEKIEKAGSLRRGCETVGDMDILAASKNAEVAMEYFVKYPGIGTILSKGDTMASVLLENGRQVDLRIVGEAELGSALVYFTGSQAHNIKLRTIAKSRGMKVSEYGVFLVNEKSGKEELIASESEEDVYKALELEWMPPELREDSGEIEAAMKGALPGHLIRTSDIKGDLHLHTDSTDGRSSLDEILEKAVSKGYEYAAITEHTKLVKVANGMDEKRLLEHIGKVRKASLKYKGLKVLVGAEVDILKDGTLDLEDYALKELDIVIIAVHSNFSLDEETQTARILRAMDNKYVNVMAHPSGRLITNRSPMQIDLDRVFRKAAENNIFLEINTHGKRIDLSDVNARRAKELGARFVIDTDAHDAGQMDNIVYGVTSARRAWLEKKDILNTYSYEKMIKSLRK